MRFTRSDIVEDVLAHIRELGGDFSEWCVGTARDREALLARSKAAQPVPDLAKAPGQAERHAAGDLGEGLIWREAYTPYAAADVAERLADCDLRPDRASVPAPRIHRLRLPAERCNSSRSVLPPGQPAGGVRPVYGATHKPRSRGIILRPAPRPVIQSPVFWGEESAFALPVFAFRRACANPNAGPSPR